MIRIKDPDRDPAMDDFDTFDLLDEIKRRCERQDKVLQQEVERANIIDAQRLGRMDEYVEIQKAQARGMTKLKEENEKLRAALKEICELRHDITCAHVIAEEALGDE